MRLRIEDEDEDEEDYEKDEEGDKRVLARLPADVRTGQNRSGDPASILSESFWMSEADCVTRNAKSAHQLIQNTRADLGFGGRGDLWHRGLDFSHLD